MCTVACVEDTENTTFAKVPVGEVPLASSTAKGRNSTPCWAGSKLLVGGKYSSSVREDTNLHLVVFQSNSCGDEPLNAIHDMRSAQGRSNPALPPMLVGESKSMRAMPDGATEAATTAGVVVWHAHRTGNEALQGVTGPPLSHDMECAGGTNPAPVGAVPFGDV